MTDDVLTRWAKVKADMREATGSVLKSHGLTWDSYRDLEAQATAAMTTELVDTEFGTVQLVVKPVHIHKDSQQIGVNKTIHLMARRPK